MYKRQIKDMAVINLTSEEFADRIEEMLDLASKGDNVLIHHEMCIRDRNSPVKRSISLSYSNPLALSF